MSTTQGVWKLQEVRDQTLAGAWVQYDSSRDSGTLWVWGRNENGQLGVGTRVCHSSPIQIPGTQWADISNNASPQLARKCDGTLWAWGNNANGQLADGTVVQRSSPIQIPGTQWNDVAAGNENVYARKTNGTLWAWGSGAVGDGTTVPRSSPVQIPGTQWNAASAGSFFVAARKTDGTLWTWGDNAYGRLGANLASYNQRSSPIQIPGTEWIDVSLGTCFALARKS